MDERRGDAVKVEIAEADFERLLQSGIRLACLRFFVNNGIRKIYLDLEGR